MKTENKNLLRLRAERALRDLYHNAELPIGEFDDIPTGIVIHYNISDPDEYLMDWQGFHARCEIEYLEEGAYGPDPRKTFESPVNGGKYKSELARRYYVRWKMNAMHREIARYAMWERATEFGKLHTHGRNGATLAPDDLIRMCGGSSFAINYDIIEKLSWERLTEMVQIVESFNRIVRAICKDFPVVWREELERMAGEMKWEVAEDLQSERPDMYAYTPAETHAV